MAMFESAGVLSLTISAIVLDKVVNCCISRGLWAFYFNLVAAVGLLSVDHKPLLEM